MVIRISVGLVVPLTLFCALGAQPVQLDNSIVNLNAVALDTRGQPVNDLAAEDFEVTDGGKTRQIAFTRHIDRRLLPSPATGPNQFSNRTGTGIPHATVILLDLMNQSFSTRGVATNQLVKYLQSVENADYLYLYLLTIDGGIYPVRGLPGPEQLPTANGEVWTRQIKQIMDGALRTVQRLRPVDMDVAVRVQLTFHVLETLAEQMSMVPGRKNIVWITDGVPIALGPVRSDTGDIVDFTPWLRQLSVALERAEIAIYPVQQIMIGSHDDVADAPGVPQTGVGTGILSAQTLNQFAQMTGGRPDAGKDIGGAVTQAMNDARTSYQIGYYQPSDSQDGKFHKVRVICKRKGVRIQSRTGYYAWPEEAEASAASAIRGVFSQASDAAEIGIRGAVSSAPGKEGTLHLSLVIDSKDVVLIHDTDHYSGQLNIVVVGYDAAGAPHPSATQAVDLRYTGQERDNILAKGIDYSLDVPVGESIASLRFITFDNFSRSIGSLTIPVRKLQRP